MNRKTIIIAGTCVMLAAAAGYVTAPNVLIAQSVWEFPKTIITTDGQTYNGVSLIRAEADGYLVSYEPLKNSRGMAKIKFSRLSQELQKHAGYDPDKAREFEASVASASRDLDQQRAAWRQEALANTQIQQTRIEAAAQIAVERESAMAELARAQASLAQTSQNDGSSGSSSWNGGFSIVGTAGNSFYVKEGFQPSTGFQPASGPAVFGNLASARGFHR